MAQVPSGGGGGPFSNNNPFLPLLQASTQFLSQKLQSFQSPATPPAAPKPPQPPPKPQQQSQPKEQEQETKSKAAEEKVDVEEEEGTPTPRSMGELLFATPPIHPLPPPPPPNQGNPSPTRGRAERQRKVDLTLQQLQQQTEGMSRKHYNPDSSYPLPTPYHKGPHTHTHPHPPPLPEEGEKGEEEDMLETMREEIRLEKGRMESLILELDQDLFPSSPKTKENGRKVNGRPNSVPLREKPSLSELRANSQPIPVPLQGALQFRNARSFSLRQTSTESEGSEMGSPGSEGLPALQRAMSCDSVSSDTSVGIGEPPHPTGLLCLGLEYDSETADLLVNVIEAKELVGPDPNSSLPFDSYVRVYLLPDKTTNMQTRVYRKSLNPVYREKFMFGLEPLELALRTLVFYLYATDKHSNTLIGEGELRLGDLDLFSPITTWLQLTDMGQRGGESGEIMFSLSYLPTAERLTVVVVKARNLKFHHGTVGDPFVKVYLLQKGKKVSKKKSSTKRGERNPIFNEAMIFSVPPHALQTIQLRITVADTKEVEGRATSVGHVLIGSSSTGKSLSHWNGMLSSLRKPIAMWHPLRK